MTSKLSDYWLPADRISLSRSYLENKSVPVFQRPFSAGCRDAYQRNTKTSRARTKVIFSPQMTKESRR